MSTTGKTSKNVYGPETVWKNGIAYPNKYWAKLEVTPVKNPDYKPGSKAPEWIHPERLSSRNNTSRAVKGGLNNISDKVMYTKAGYDAGKLAYDVENSAYNPFTGKMVKTGNAFGRFGSGIKGALIGAGIASWNKVLNEVLGEHNPHNKRISDILWKSGVPMSRKPSRTGKKVATNEEVEKMFDEKLNKEKSSFLSKVGKQLGKLTTASGRASIQANIVGTAEGIARGIAESEIGKAAIAAGKNAYESVKSGLFNALEGITAFFNPKKRAELRAKKEAQKETEREAEDIYFPKKVTAT